MSARQPRFEIVRTNARQQWFGRFIASNGREIWRTSESYARHRGAVAALNQILAFIPPYNADRYEIREVDEREFKRCPRCGAPSRELNSTSAVHAARLVCAAYDAEMEREVDER